MLRSIITGTGSYLPTVIKKNCDFAANDFFSENNMRLDRPAAEIALKFQQITGIDERKYAGAGITASDMGTRVARQAIAESGIDPEQIDQIILAHNFGNVEAGTSQADTVPALASRVKHNLGIKNPNCIPYDLLFGCPGWLQGLIHASVFFKAGMARTCLVIGTETLSRVLDPFDRDSMIFADGAGAGVIEYKETGNEYRGILSSIVRSDTCEEIDYIHFGKSYHPTWQENTRFLKMKGRKVYEYALRYVPAAMKECLDASGVPIHSLKKIFIHQANEKMDEAIVRAFYKLYDIPSPPDFITPMNIQWFGNSSVATIPTLLDLVKKGHFPEHTISKNDIVLFASVGAGMNINAITYGC